MLLGLSEMYRCGKNVGNCTLYQIANSGFGARTVDTCLAVTKLGTRMFNAPV